MVFCQPFRYLMRLGRQELNEQSELLVVLQLAFPAVYGSDGAVDLNASGKTGANQFVGDALGIGFRFNGGPAQHQHAPIVRPARLSASREKCP